ncbi:hypothetical protein OMAG_001741 [Candidatus Omnitrophus magneticus]|uniref:Uncharacterized protein n=1 Tax=Candidatus Omnitrophus magneticus TaxID=1609969 RepID=A0A0F0CLS8_9BACT|nr:hypothetical protein OMAG_001741 [Candidatus Omnitrophus magneticus]
MIKETVYFGDAQEEKIKMVFSGYADIPGTNDYAPKYRTEYEYSGDAIARTLTYYVEGLDNKKEGGVLIGDTIFEGDVATNRVSSKITFDVKTGAPIIMEDFVYESEITGTSVSADKDGLREVRKYETNEKEFDVNGNGIIDAGEDLNNDGKLGNDYDVNGDGKLDDADSDGKIGDVILTSITYFVGDKDREVADYTYTKADDGTITSTVVNYYRGGNRASDADWRDPKEKVVVYKGEVDTESLDADGNGIFDGKEKDVVSVSYYDTEHRLPGEEVLNFSESYAQGNVIRSTVYYYGDDELRASDANYRLPLKKAVTYWSDDVNDNGEIDSGARIKSATFYFIDGKLKGEEVQDYTKTYLMDGVTARDTTIYFYEGGKRAKDVGVEERLERSITYWEDSVNKDGSLKDDAKKKSETVNQFGPAAQRGQEVADVTINYYRDGETVRDTTVYYYHGDTKDLRASDANYRSGLQRSATYWGNALDEVKLVNSDGTYDKEGIKEYLLLKLGINLDNLSTKEELEKALLDKASGGAGDSIKFILNKDKNVVENIGDIIKSLKDIFDGNSAITSLLLGVDFSQVITKEDLIKAMLIEGGMAGDKAELATILLAADRDSVVSSGDFIEKIISIFESKGLGKTILEEAVLGTVLGSDTELFLQELKGLASKELRDFLDTIDLTALGIGSVLELIQYLKENASAKGYTASEVMTLSETLSLGKIDEFKEFYDSLKNTAEGKLGEFLEKIDIQALGIMTLKELVEYLFTNALNNGYTEEEVLELLGIKVFSDAESIDLVLDKMKSLASGKLLDFLKGIDLKALGISTLEELETYLRNNAVAQGYDVSLVDAMLEEMALLGVSDVTGFAATFKSLSSGSLRRFLNSLNLEVEGITSVEEFILFLKDNASSNGFYYEDIVKILGDMAGLGIDKTRVFLEKMITSATGALKVFLEGINLTAQGIDSLEELIEYLVNNAFTNGYTEDDVMEVLSGIAESARSDVEGFIESLLRISSGNLKMFLSGVNPELLGIKRISDLLEYLIDNAEANGYSESDVVSLIEEGFSGLQLNELFSAMIERADGNLKTFIESIDLNVEKILSVAEFIQYLRDNAQSHGYTNEDITALLGTILGDIYYDSPDAVLAGLLEVAEGNLKTFLEGIDLAVLGITTIEGLLEYLKNNMTAGGYVYEDIMDALGLFAAISMEDVYGVLLGLQEFAAGSLKEFLSNLDVYKEGIFTVTRLMEYLKENAAINGFTSDDVVKLFIELSASALENVDGLLNKLSAVAKGDLKIFIDSIDLDALGISTISSLIEYLETSASANGYTIDDVLSALIEVASTVINEAESLLAGLKDLSSGALNTFLKTIDLQQEGIKTAKELIDYLIDNAAGNGYLAGDVHALLLKLVEAGANGIYDYVDSLRNLAEGNIKDLLNNINIIKLGITTKTELIEYLRSKSAEAGFTEAELFTLLAIEKARNADGMKALLAVFVSKAKGNLKDFLETMDLELLGITNLKELYEYLKENMSANSYAEEDIRSMLLELIGDADSLLTDYLGLLEDRATGVLKLFISGINLNTEGITTISELIKYLKDNAAANGYTEADVDALIALLGINYTDKVKSFITDLLTFAEGNLKLFLQGIDVDAEGISNVSELIQYLKERALANGYTEDDVLKAIVSVMIKDIEDAAELKNELEKLASGNLKIFIEGLDLLALGITSAEELYAYLKEKAAANGYTEKEVLSLFVLFFAGSFDEVARVLDGLISLSSGNLKTFLEKIDPVSLGIMTISELIAYLKDNALANGFTEEDVLNLFLDFVISSSGTVSEFLLALKGSASGALKTFIDTIDLVALGISTIEELIQYLKNNAGANGYTAEDVENLIISLAGAGLTSVQGLLDDLIGVASSGNLKTFMEGLDLAALGIDTIEELIQYLKDNALANGYTEEEVTELLLLLAVGNQSVDEFFNNLLGTLIGGDGTLSGLVAMFLATNLSTINTKEELLNALIVTSGGTNVSEIKALINELNKITPISEYTTALGMLADILALSQTIKDANPQGVSLVNQLRDLLINSGLSDADLLIALKSLSAGEGSAKLVSLLMDSTIFPRDKVSERVITSLAVYPFADAFSFKY